MVSVTSRLLSRRLTGFLRYGSFFNYFFKSKCNYYYSYGTHCQQIDGNHTPPESAKQFCDKDCLQSCNPDIGCHGPTPSPTPPSPPPPSPPPPTNDHSDLVGRLCVLWSCGHCVCYVYVFVYANAWVCKCMRAYVRIQQYTRMHASPLLLSPITHPDLTGRSLHRRDAELNKIQQPAPLRVVLTATSPSSSDAALQAPHR